MSADTLLLRRAARDQPDTALFAALPLLLALWLALGDRGVVEGR
jgi:hypothetical protein